MTLHKQLYEPTASRNYRCQQGLGAGAVVGTGATVREMIPVSQLLRARVRFKLSAGDGTLAFKFVKPDANGRYNDDGTSVYASGNPTDLAVPDTTEVNRDIDLYGEAFLLLEYTDTTGGSTIEFCDVSTL